MDILKRGISAVLALVLVAEMLPVPPAKAAEDSTTETETVSAEWIPMEETAVTTPATTAVEETEPQTTETPEETLPAETTVVMTEATAVSEEAEAVLSESGALEYSYSVDASTGAATITGYTGTAVEVTVPAQLDGHPVTAIGDNAFQNAALLVSVVLPEGLLRIGKNAFEGCKLLETVVLPDSVTTIGYRAFAECTALSSINYPLNWENTISHGSWNGGIFYNCSSLSTITVPEGVQAIPTHAFQSANCLQEIILPESLTTIGEAAFQNCSALKKINIPDGLTVIHKWAFENCKALTSLTLPDTITTIGYRAFAECTALSSINYPLNWTKTISHGSWNGGIFYNCTSLLEMTVPEGVEKIAPNAFESANCLQEISLPQSLTTLGAGAFFGCTALTEVTLPESVATIHDQAFSNCSALAKINIPEAVTVIPKWAFENCKALTELSLPDSITTIGYHAFAECTSLSSINFPLNWTNTISHGSWNGGIFYNCTSLTSMTVPEGVEKIPAHAFTSANTLQEIHLPESLTTIGEAAFQSCSALKKINIPDGVTVIHKWAFENCKALTELSLPDSITTIGYHAFAECSALSSINYPLNWTKTISHGSWNGGIFYNCTSLLEMTVPEGVEEIAPNAFESANCLQEITLPQSLTTLGAGAFAGCTALTEVTLPESVATIHDQAFSNCSALAKINIPEAVTVIPKWAFENCKALTELSLPDSITTIGYHAFAECSALSSINYPLNWTSTISHGSWNGGIFYNCSSLNTITVPEGVQTIPAHAFQSANCLQEIILPESLTTIGEAAFQSCSALKKINIPDGVTVIHKWAFENCKALTSLALPDTITTIGYHAFAECTSLSSINFPRNWTNTISHGSWNGGIFYNCTNLTSMTVPEGAVTIPAHAFASANALQEIHLPESLTKIGEKAFADCNALRNLQIPEGVTTIGKGAFQGCGSLIRLGIPSSVTSIGSGCFQGAGDVVIYCTYNSYATLYAIENNLLFVNTDEFEDSQQYALEKEACRYYAEVKAITAGGYVSIGVQYAIKDSWKDRVSDLQLQLVLPQNIDLDEFTLKLDGQICTDYSFDNNRVLRVPVTKPEGKLTFSVKMNGQTGLFSYAALSMKKDGTQTKEIVGILNEEVNVLTLEAPQAVGTQEISLSGIAPLSAEISLAVDGAVQKTVTASKAGNWSATVTISNPKDCETYRITAQCDGLKQEANVTYRLQEPELTGFEMYYNEHNKIKECDLMDSSGTKPKVYFLPGTQFDFQVTFDHPEKIDKVYVSSTRNQEIKYLEATYDAEKGAFVTDGFFDSDNKNYVPGSLRVEYTKKTETVKVSDTFDWEVFDSQLSKNAVEYTQATQTQLSGLVDLGSVFGDLSGVIVDASISCYDEETDGNLADWLGAFSDVDTLASYTVPGYNGEKYLLTMDYSDPGNWLMLVHDVTGNQYIKLSLKNAMDSAETMEKFGKLQAVSSTLSTVNTVAGMLLKQHEISTDMDQLREDVMRTSYATSEERAAALKQVDALESDQSWFYLITAVIPLVAISAPAAAGAAVMAGPAIMLTAMLGVFGAMAPMFFDMRAGMIKGQSYRVNFVIDPSGYVYDNVTNARLEGVTASAYWIPYDESEDFWNNVPDAAEYGTLWNAGEYDQENPLLTNADGKYAWDVPEGWWRVKYEKDGYETTWSEWLPVPPPQTEVNIGMIPTGHSFSLGDVNHDTKINAKDATLILQKSVGVLKETTKFCEVCAEVSGDGKLNAKDSTLILQFSVGLRDSFPAES